MSRFFDTKSESSGTTLKFGFLALLAAGLLFPLALVEDVMVERQSAQAAAVEEIAELWGGRQVVAGPILSVPYVTGRVTSDSDPQITYASDEQRRILHILPEELSVNGDLHPEILRRGVFDAVVYSSQIEMKGTFAEPESDPDHPPRKYFWKDAVVSFGVADIRGIQRKVTLEWNGDTEEFEPGAGAHWPFESGRHGGGSRLDPATLKLNEGMHAKAPSRTGDNSFRIVLAINGSRALEVVPLGRANRIALSGPWGDPSFSGASPSSREISDGAFHAVWERPFYARSFPQVWNSDAPGQNELEKKMLDARAGVELLMTVDFYRKCLRAAKYGLLFIALTAVTFFLFEVSMQMKIHPLQYMIVGLALCLFYLLLVAFSEVFAFPAAYTLAAAPTIASISLYSYAFTKHRTRSFALFLAAILIMLYSYLYVLLQLEELSLLMGSLGLFAALSALMYATRHLNQSDENFTCEVVE